MSEHGYLRYAEGCRCQVCRAGKTAYIRGVKERSRLARIAAEAQGRHYVVEGIAHGMNGYQYHNCRCLTCREVTNDYFAEYRRRKAEEGAA